MPDNLKNTETNASLPLHELLSAVLASDLAQEIDAEFTGRRTMGFDVPAASAHVFGRFHSALTSASDGPVVLIALAALQVRDDYLQPVIRDAAVDLIESGEALNAYRSAESSQRKSVRQMLEQFGALLQTTVCISDE